MSRMMKTKAELGAQAALEACVILHVVEARAGGHKNQGYSHSLVQ